MNSRIVELATKIFANVNEIDNYIQSNNLCQPSFDVDGPLELEIESAYIRASRESAIDALVQLQDLLKGPKAILRPEVRPLQVL